MSKEDFIFGTRAVIEAIKNGKFVDKVLVKKGLNNELFQELFKLMKAIDIPFQFVPIEKINRITRKNHQGVLALISPIEYYKVEDILPGIYEKGEDPLILILDGITDVRNFGAIIRSAECAGVHTVVIPDKGMSRIGADAVKTSAGALHHMPICRVRNLNNVIEFLKNSGITIISADEKAEKIYTNAEMNIPLAIVMGSEDVGVSKTILDKSDLIVKIPLLGRMDSLNVSVAAAVMLYEAVRQRAIL